MFLLEFYEKAEIKSLKPKDAEHWLKVAKTKSTRIVAKSLKKQKANKKLKLA